MKSQVSTDREVTSNDGMKADALKNEPELYLESFGEMNELFLESFEKAEKYLVWVLQRNSEYTNFNELRYKFLQQNLYMKLKHYNHSNPPEMFFNKMFC